MNVEIGAEAEHFPEKEYINGIAVAVQSTWMNGRYCFLIGGNTRYNFSLPTQDRMSSIFIVRFCVNKLYP
jgi:hypothetical protein